MSYAKPEIMKIADATAAICFGSTMSKSMAGADLSNPHQMTPPAYSVDEE